jgi:DNA repair exonuclease SbcCD ATPase subunit
MRIKTATLSNYCQHRLRELNFEAGVTFITGLIGSGKSNAFRGIRGTLTGDFESRKVGGKQEDITYGLESGTDGYVKTEWELDNNMIVSIKRNIINTGSAEIHLIDPKNHTIAEHHRGKETEATDHITRLTGLNNQVIQNCMFIGQRKTAEIFSATPSQRVDTLIHLTDAMLAREFAASIRKRLTRLQIFAEEYDETAVTVTNQNYVELRDKYEVISKKLNSLKEQLLVPIVRSQLERVVSQYETRTAAEKAVKIATSKSAKLKVVIEKKQAKISKLEKAKEKLTRQLAKAKEVYQASLTVYNNHKQINESVTAYEEAQKILQVPSPEPPQPVTYSKHVLSDSSEIKKSIRDIVKQIDECTSLLNMHKDKVCVTCKRPFKITDEQADKARADINKLKPQLNALNDIADDFEQFKLDTELYKRELNTWKTNRDKAKQLVAKYSTKPERVSVVSPSKDEVNEIEQKLKDLNKKFEQGRDSLDSLIVRLNEHMTTIKIKKETVAKTDNVSKSAAIQAKKTLESQQQIATEVEELTETYIDMRSKLAVRVQSLRAALAAKRKFQKVGPKLEFLSVANKVCSKLPERSVAEFARFMEPSINAKLEQFGMDFQLSVDESFEFSVTRNGHTFMHKRMSGGQSCVSGLAFWLSVAEVAGIDCLFMDEPIDGLDPTARALLPSVFSNIDSAFRQQGKQLIVVTHYPQLAVVGQRIHFN